MECTVWLFITNTNLSVNAKSDNTLYLIQSSVQAKFAVRKVTVNNSKKI